ncbi:MAG TPA: DUF4159 domain-containing protein [Verrucomicrobiae bacterium]|jgi:hypothetical protein
MTRPQKFLLSLGAATLFVVFGFAQYGGNDDRDQTVHETEGNIVFRGGRLMRIDDGMRFDEETVTTARAVIPHSTDVPVWTNEPGFDKDVFTFCRLRYISASYGGWRQSMGKWTTDFPDSDMNLSFRLQQMTSLKVSPDGRFLRLNNKDLYDYPWIYMVEPGRLVLNEEEVKILRDYLNNGGFLMADDFWGDRQWENFAMEMKKVFPEREFQELEMDHPIFHTVFDLQMPKQQLQTPNIGDAMRSLDPNSPYFGVTWETRTGPTAEEMHVRAITDEKKRIMVIATHNCDNGDGWERETVGDGAFFQTFSEKRAFPLGINIIVYAMTH